MDLAAQFERDFIMAVERIRKKSDLKIKEFAAIAFPDQAKPDNKWQRILAGKNPLKKGQSVSIEDAFRICIALNRHVSEVMWKVEHELKEKKKKNSIYIPEDHSENTEK